jgi:hypothetical protein
MGVASASLSQYTVGLILVGFTVLDCQRYYQPADEKNCAIGAAMHKLDDLRDAP